MQTITTAADIRTWIANANPGGILNEPSLVAPLAEAIRAAAGRPAWGTDWEEWLVANAERLTMGVVNRRAGRRYVAIASDGTRPVVWGMEETAEDARAEALSEGDDGPVSADELRMCEVDDARAAHIDAGDVDASDLWEAASA